jgi:hypothetical protein
MRGAFGAVVAAQTAMSIFVVGLFVQAEGASPALTSTNVGRG